MAMHVTQQVYEFSRKFRSCITITRRAAIDSDSLSMAARATKMFLKE